MPTCDQQRIEKFLAHQLSAAEESELEQHLSSCETCCRTLESATAEHRWWSDATTFLPDEVDDLDSACLATRDFAAGEPVADGIPLAGAIQNVLQLLAPTDDPAMLGRLGSYEIVGVVGAGGMSVVLKGFDRSLNRYVAIKVLSPQLSTSGAARQRFAREAQAAAAVVHENVIAIHGVEDGPGLPYLVMPYIRGESLQKRIDRRGPLQVEEILRIGHQTAAGLAAAHAKGLVHRDVKPANILLANGVERVTITDFGLARAADDASLTSSGMIAGTPQYMSPEQARGETMDARSDLFSLGSVLYAMCTARPPFRSETSYGVLRRITDTEPRPIPQINHQIPGWLCRLISRLHAKQPEDRYTTAEQVAHDLEQCLAHVHRPDRQPLPEALRTPSWLRKHRRAVVCSLATLLLTFIGVAVFPHRPQPDSDQTSQTADTLRGTGTESRAGTERQDEAADAPVERTPPVPADSQRTNVSLWDDGIEQMLLETELELQALERQFDRLVVPEDY